EGFAFVVEGYMDLIALYQFGIKNVVATLGTAFTAEHAANLKKLTQKAIVLFDGDEAGQTAAEKSLSFFFDKGLPSKCLLLPFEMDPDDFLHTHGVEKFKELAHRAPDHFLWYLGRVMQGFTGQPIEKNEIMSKISPLLGYVRDQGLRTLYTMEVA